MTSLDSGGQRSQAKAKASLSLDAGELKSIF